MYIAKQFAQTDTNILHDLINAKPLATWITQYADGELIVDHLPFILDPDRGEFGTLISHVSKANPLWKRFANSTQSICVFHGVDGYISPTWYVDSKSEHGKAVPTWNYVTVHVYGQAKPIDDLEEIRHILEITTKKFEADLTPEWTMQDAPERYIEKMLTAIVGVEIPINQMIGKYKLNQNKNQADRMGVIAGLKQQGDSTSLEMAQMIQQGLDIESANKEP